MTRRRPGALRRLAETVGFSLCKLNEIEFAAPWNPRPPSCRRGREGDAPFPY
jgi:hypothetical protein